MGEPVIVGRVGRPHGIRGEVTIDVRTDLPERRFAAGAVLDRAETGGTLVVARSRWHAGRLLVLFEGVDGRDGAEALRGTLLAIDSDASGPAVDPDEGADDDLWWDRELVGLRARTSSGTVIGEVVDVIHSPAGELLAIGRPGGGEHLVPFVREIVPTVDPQAGHIVVDPPPGLLDLD